MLTEDVILHQSNQIKRGRYEFIIYHLHVCALPWEWRRLSERATKCPHVSCLCLCSQWWQQLPGRPGSSTASKSITQASTSPSRVIGDHYASKRLQSLRWCRAQSAASDKIFPTGRGAGGTLRHTHTLNVLLSRPDGVTFPPQAYLPIESSHLPRCPPTFPFFFFFSFLPHSSSPPPTHTHILFSLLPAQPAPHRGRVLNTASN